MCKPRERKIAHGLDAERVIEKMQHEMKISISSKYIAGTFTTQETRVIPDHDIDKDR